MMATLPTYNLDEIMAFVTCHAFRVTNIRLAKLILQVA
jgi:hypothetical protein